MYLFIQIVLRLESMRNLCGGKTHWLLFSIALWLWRCWRKTIKTSIPHFAFLPLTSKPLRNIRNCPLFQTKGYADVLIAIFQSQGMDYLFINCYLKIFIANLLAATEDDKFGSTPGNAETVWKELKHRLQPAVVAIL